jgi:hypothetical protein
MPFECHLGVLILDVIMLSAVILVAVLLNAMAPQIFLAFFGETDLIPIQERATSNVREESCLRLGFQL